MERKYEKSWDGLRAMAAIFVLLFHAHVPGFAHGGWDGVQIFFVLSGYLITSILLGSPGRTDLARFWVGRIRRLVPALLLMLTVVAALTPALMPGHLADMWVWCLLALTYTMNFAMSEGYRLTPVTHTWTLALEMQFYLIWPLLLPWIRRLRSPAFWLIGVWLILSAIADFAPVGELGRTYSPLRAAPLLLGCAFSFLPSPKAIWGWVGAALVIVGMFPPLPLVDEVYNHIPMFDLGAALLIGALRQPSALSRALAWGPLPALGLISYGIYLWHYPILEVLGGLDWQVRVAIALPMSILAATASYITVERMAGAAKRPLSIFPSRPVRATS